MKSLSRIKNKATNLYYAVVNNKSDKKKIIYLYLCIIYIKIEFSYYIYNYT